MFFFNVTSNSNFRKSVGGIRGVNEQKNSCARKIPSISFPDKPHEFSLEKFTRVAGIAYRYV